MRDTIAKDSDYLSVEKTVGSLLNALGVVHNGIITDDVTIEVWKFGTRGRKSKIADKFAFLEDAKVLSTKELADKYGVSTASVCRMKRKNNLITYKSTSAPADFVEYAQEHNKSQAIAHYKVSYYTIKKWECLTGCRCSRQHGSGLVKRNKLIKELSKTSTYETIGKMYGISRQRVEQIVNQNKGDDK